jgi:hypothetical protein
MWLLSCRPAPAGTCDQQDAGPAGWPAGLCCPWGLTHTLSGPPLDCTCARPAQKQWQHLLGGDRPHQHLQPTAAGFKEECSLEEPKGPPASNAAEQGTGAVAGAAVVVVANPAIALKPAGILRPSAAAVAAGPVKLHRLQWASTWCCYRCTTTYEAAATLSVSLQAAGCADCLARCPKQLWHCVTTPSGDTTGGSSGKPKRPGNLPGNSSTVVAAVMENTHLTPHAQTPPESCSSHHCLWFSTHAFYPQPKACQHGLDFARCSCSWCRWGAYTRPIPTLST